MGNFFFERMASAATFGATTFAGAATSGTSELFYLVQTYSLPLKIVQRKRNKKYFHEFNGKLLVLNVNRF
jgi:hypothetical protein